MSSRPVSTSSTGYTHLSQTPRTTPTCKTYTNQQRYMEALAAIEAAAQLARLHQNTPGIPATTPDASHMQAEQKQHLRKQTVMKEMKSIEADMANLRKEMRSSEKGNARLLLSDAENRLEALKERHKLLSAELAGPASASGPSPSDGSKGTVSSTSTSSTSDEENSTRPPPSSSSSTASSSSSSSLDPLQKKLAETNVMIRRTEMNLRRAEQKGMTKQVAALKAQLADLKMKRESLYQQIVNEDMSLESTTDMSATMSDESASSLDSSDAGSTSSSTNDVAVATKRLKELEKSLAALQEKANELGINSSEDETGGNAEKIKQLTDEIDSLRKFIGLFPGRRTGENKKTAEAHNLSSLVRTKTAQRPQQAEDPRHGSAPHDNAQADLASLHDIAKSQALRMPEDHKQRFQAKDANRIATLEQEMERLATQGDAAFQNYNRLRKAIERDRQSGEVGPKTMEAKERTLNRYKTEWLQCSTKILPLIEQWESLFEHASSGPAKSAKQRAEERKVLIETHKGDETSRLEKIYSDMLAKRQEDVKNNPGCATLWDNVAGIAGFSVSFLVGNSIGRLFPGAVWLGSALSASSHVMLATPVVKNLMARVWSADSLSELNNHFKLRGNEWGDWWRGDTEAKKYTSKDPQQTDKLIIGERLAEEKNFSELVGNRYKDEEAAYWLYSANYSIKAAMCAYMSHYMSQNTTDVKLIEGALHGVMGMISGGEYIVLQQHARSARPNATMNVVPTQAIFAAQAEYLKSLHADLVAAIQPDPQNPNAHLDAASLRALRRESARVAKEASVAETKSHWGGIARQELSDQFEGDAKWDTLSEVVGRMITLIPVSTVTHLTVAWRTSPDPLWMFLGHFVPAIVLMLPLPLPGATGFTGRPWVCGLIRAGIQSFLNGRVRPTVTTQVPQAVRKPEPTEHSDDGPIVGVSDDSDINSSSSTTSTESVIVELSGSELDTDESWDGNPTERDKNAAN